MCIFKKICSILYLIVFMFQSLILRWWHWYLIVLNSWFERNKITLFVIYPCHLYLCYIMLYLLCFFPTIFLLSWSLFSAITYLKCYLLCNPFIKIVSDFMCCDSSTFNLFQYKSWCFITWSPEGDPSLILIWLDQSNCLSFSFVSSSWPGSPSS